MSARPETPNNPLERTAASFLRSSMGEILECSVRTGFGARYCRSALDR
jgi:hypothetical protein